MYYKRDKVLNLNSSESVQNVEQQLVRLSRRRGTKYNVSFKRYKIKAGKDLHNLWRYSV